MSETLEPNIMTVDRTAENHVPVTSSRLVFVDVAKGFGILLVLVEHVMASCSAPWWGIRKPILAFHMPLFFLLSGLFFRPLESPTGRQRFPWRWLSAYFFYAFIGLLLIPTNRKLIPTDWPTAGQRLYSLMIHGSPWLNGPLWFLVSLAVVSDVFTFVHRVFGRFRTAATQIGFLACCAFGTLLASQLPASFRAIWSPFMVATVPCGCFFYAIGWMSRNTIRKMADWSSIQPFLAFALAMVGFAIVTTVAGSGPRYLVLLAQVESWKFFPIASLGIASSLVFCSSISAIRLNPLGWIGRHSLTFFALDRVVRAWIHKGVYHSFAAFGAKPADHLILFFVLSFMFQIIVLSLLIRPAEWGLKRFRALFFRCYHN